MTAVVEQRKSEIVIRDGDFVAVVSKDRISLGNGKAEIVIRGDTVTLDGKVVLA